MAGVYILFCLFAISLVGAEVVQVVPQEIASVNGSAADMGCTSQIDSGGVVVCDCSYLVDGVSPDIDTSTSDWASQLVTVRRSEGTADVIFPHVLLTFGFDTAVSLTGIEIDLFNCPDWNIGAPRITLYLNPEYNLVYNSSVETFSLPSQLPESSCDSLSTATFYRSSLDAGSYRIIHILVDLIGHPLIKWLHVGEVRFIKKNEGDYSAGKTCPPKVSTTTTTIMSTATTSHSCEDSTASCSVYPSATIIDGSGSTIDEMFPTNSTRNPTDDNKIGITIGLSVTFTIIFIVCVAIVIVGLTTKYFVKSRRNKTKFSDPDIMRWENGAAADSSIEYREENRECKNDDYEGDHAQTTFPQAELPKYEDCNTQMYNPSFANHEQVPSEAVYDEVPKENLAALGDATDYDDIEPPGFLASYQGAHAAQSVTDQQGGEQSTSHVYSHVKKNTPAVPKKSNDLVKYLAVRAANDQVPGSAAGGEAVRHGSLSSRSQLAYNPVYEVSSEALSLETHKFLDSTTGEEMYDRPTIHRASPLANVHEGFAVEMEDRPLPSAPFVNEPIRPSDFTGNYQDEEAGDPHIYAPVYAVPTLAPEVPQPVVITNDNIVEKKELGMGQFGRVVLAATNGLSLKDMKMSEADNNKNVSILVAVKRLAAKPSMEDRQVFEKEVKLMSCLKHQNVVSLIGVCYQDPAFIMMEYMEEGDLNRFLKRYSEIVPIITISTQVQITTSTLVYMASQIASAMQYLASHNYIHRDLASRNCLVGGNFVVKLADFGMSKSLYQSHYYRIQGNAVLPIRWMATESFFGIFSEKTDVWAFGVTMWELFTLAKQDPYSHFTDTQLVEDAIRGVNRQLLEKPPSCPKSLYKVMQQCWVVDPKGRANFRAVEEMLQTYWYTPDAAL